MAEKHDGIRSREILFGLPFWLAKRRLKRQNLWVDLNSSKVAELAVTSDKQVRHALKYDHIRDLYLAGREFFTWEKSLLCPICFHWWITVAVGAVLLAFNLLDARADYPLAALTYLVNHFIIRKIS